jgi:ABC-2 type transport system permease protein
VSDLALHGGISFNRIGAMILRYWYLLLSSWPRLLELAYWPVLQVITWGFLQSYIAQNANFFARAGGTLIGAVILWDILFRGQLGFSISFLEEMWARNLGNLMMIFTSWAVGIFVSGLVLRHGLGAESIVWTLMFALMPLACVYYPVQVLPLWLQYVSWSLPPTYVFEGMRALLIDHVFRADLMLSALVINAALLVACFAAFLALLRSARRHGSLLGGGE